MQQHDWAFPRCFRVKTYIIHEASAIPENTKHLYNIFTMLDQRRRRWADVVLMLYKCFVFAGLSVNIIVSSLARLIIHDHAAIKT